MNAEQAWQRTLDQLEKEMSCSCFERWVQGAHMVSFERGLFRIGASDDLSRDWLENQQTDRVRDLLAGFLERAVRVEFIVEQRATELTPSRSGEWEGLTLLAAELVENNGLIVAAVGGKVWVHSRTNDRICQVTINRLAQELGVSRRSLQQTINGLIASGYGLDLRSCSLQHRPHRYPPAERMGPFDLGEEPFDLPGFMNL